MMDTSKISKLATWVANHMDSRDLIEYVTGDLVEFYKKNPVEFDYEWNFHAADLGGVEE